MTDTATAAASAVAITRDFAFPPARLWRALTSGALLAEWLMPNDFAPVQGHRFQFRAPPMPNWDGVVEAEVLEITPETHLAIRWASGALQTVVTFALTPTPAGVRLHFEQTGFGPDQVQNRNGAAWGWPRNFDRLEALLTKES